MWGPDQLTAVLFFSLHHFGQFCEIQLDDRVIFIKTDEETVFLSVLAMPSVGQTQLIWKMDSRAVAKMKKSNATVYWDRVTLTPNGTLELHKPQKEDRGTFRLEGYDSNGKCAFSGNVQLELQDPVSRPVVSVVSCGSGQAELRCEVEQGDNVSFSWHTMGGSANTSLGVTTEEGRVLSIRGNISGDLVCVATNAVSKESSTPLKLDCHGE
ncbi:hypothetical protein AGOR_G00072720 [Albula goreensis]|uniref:Ig-like domain-containing protein n=1 Tax=Albula goreensis TaxID=1534307 RepID=A0A8T3DRN6_9TELE|nr:hypothetical protein AGOR_G00072720 [Albula goreensis]